MASCQLAQSGRFNGSSPWPRCPALARLLRSPPKKIAPQITFCPSRINSPHQRDIHDRWKIVTACDLLGIFPLHNVRYWGGRRRNAGTRNSSCLRLDMASAKGTSGALIDITVISQCRNVYFCDRLYFSKTSLCTAER